MPPKGYAQVPFADVPYPEPSSAVEWQQRLADVLGLF
jgi:hypothetical protein